MMSSKNDVIQKYAHDITNFDFAKKFWLTSTQFNVPMGHDLWFKSQLRRAFLFPPCVK